MKMLTNAGNGPLVVPGVCKLQPGETFEISDEQAASLAAQPHLRITILDAPVRRPKRPPVSQPEAHEGEGQPTASDPEKE